VSFQNDYVSAYREATLLGPVGIAPFRPREQADHCRFANTWARTLRQQGCVAAARGQRGARALRAGEARAP